MARVHSYELTANSPTPFVQPGLLSASRRLMNTSTAPTPAEETPPPNEPAALPAPASPTTGGNP